MFWSLIHTDRANTKHLQLKTKGANANQNLTGDLDSRRHIMCWSDGGDEFPATAALIVVLAAG